jgi:serine/threonine-protein kinase
LVHERYRVVAPVGRGGLGTVYQVTDALFGPSSIYALKEQWDLSDSARKQFAREGAWLKNLDHNSIPKVREYFEWSGRLYLVMDFVDGENLEQKLDRGGGRPLPEGQVLTWVLPICDALLYLHTRTPPLIHRDIKPSNIIITPTGHPVLVDLGIAKEHAPGAGLTATFVRKAGTEGYAPPEQYAANGQTGPWSDVYALGATLYQLLTAQVPPTAVERVALDHKMHRPRELNPAVSQATDTAILRALAIRPQDRFQSMPEFKQALHAASAAVPSYLSPSYLSTPSPIPDAISRPGPFQQSAVQEFPPRPRRAQALVATAARTPGALSAPGRASGSRVSRRVPLTRSTTGSDVTLAASAGRAAVDRPLFGLHPAVLVGGLAALVLVTAIAITVAVRVLSPLDLSTPHATVSGYISALQSRDYQRAWQCMTSSNKGGSESNFISGLTSDDQRYGTVTAFTFTSSAPNGPAAEQETISVTRSKQPNAPMTLVISLTQYGNQWLIDSVSSE